MKSGGTPGRPIFISAFEMTNFFNLGVVFFVNLYIFSEILAKEEKYNLNFFSNVTHFFSLLNINNEVKIMLFLFTSILQFFLLISLPLLGGGEVPQTFLVGPLKS